MLREQIAAQRSQQPQGEAEPKRESFESYEAYLEARAEWRADQKVKERLESYSRESQGREQQGRQAANQAELARQWTERENAYRAKNPKYEEVVGAYVESEIGDLSDAARRLIVSSKVGPNLLAHLAENPADHDRIIAVRATPPGIVDGEHAVLDALLSAKDGATSEAPPLAAQVISPVALMSALKKDGDNWVVEMPSAADLDAARTELKLEPGAPVPLRVGVGYVVNGTELGALKTVMLGTSIANPILAEMIVDGESLDAKAEIMVPSLTDVRFSTLAIPDDDVNWLTNVGEMHDFDLPESYLRVEDDEDKFEGQLALVKRTMDGGVVWRVWPIRIN
jgi:hypothetical protein